MSTEKDITTVCSIYCRLSRDDGQDSESNSITNQKKLLRKYAREKGFTIYKEYVDDGYSGTTFDRPAFKQMIKDIEKGKIGIVIVKDMSRLGRHNALVAYYTEIFFPDNDVRFIAVTENIDTFEGDNEMMAFKSVINDYYAREISKKVRSIKRTMALNGDYYGGHPPYGYKRDPNNKHQLIIDEESAPNVKRIFQLAANGRGTYQIARLLTKDNILMPRAYLAKKYQKYISTITKNYPTEWHSSTIKGILRNRMYLGHMVLHKEESKSFKNKKVVQVPRTEWIEVQNKHEPIVDEHLFELAQKIAQYKPKTKPVESLFRGLLKCSDCGCTLYQSKRSGTPKNGKQFAYYCTTYRMHRNRCTSHFIYHEDLYTLVIEDIKRKLKEANITERELITHIERITEKHLHEQTKHLRDRLAKHERRSFELELVIQKLFEQQLKGILSEDNFSMMIKNYEEEQRVLREQMEKIKKQLEEEEKKIKPRNLKKLAKEYATMPTLTTTILYELIDHITVYSAENPRTNRKQRIEIYYKFC